MPQVNDLIYDALEAQGYPGAVPDKLLAWWRALAGSTTGTINDNAYAFLSAAYPTAPQALPDLLLHWLQDLGYSGSYSQMWLDFWEAGGISAVVRNVLIVGDSVAYRPSDPHYPQYLNAANIIQNDGSPGDTLFEGSADISTNFTGYLTATPSASAPYLIINAGNNDISGSFNPFDTTATQLKAEMSDLILEAIDDNRQVIVIDCSPQGDPNNVLLNVPDVATGNDRLAYIDEYNSWIAAYCAAIGVKFVSMYDLITDGSQGISDSLQQPDGIHVNEAGAQLLASAVDVQLRLPDIIPSNANLAMRARPNPELMSVDEINAVVSLIDGLGDEWDDTVEFWYLAQSDVTASGNALTGLKAGIVATVGAGAPSNDAVNGGMAFASGEYLNSNIDPDEINLVDDSMSLGVLLTDEQSPTDQNVYIWGGGLFAGSSLEMRRANDGDGYAVAGNRTNNAQFTTGILPTGEVIEAQIIDNGNSTNNIRVFEDGVEHPDGVNTAASVAPDGSTDLKIAASFYSDFFGLQAEFVGSMACFYITNGNTTPSLWNTTIKNSLSIIASLGGVLAISSAAINVAEASPFTITVNRSGMSQDPVIAQVAISNDLANDSPQVVSWLDGELGPKDADFVASLVDGDDVGSAVIVDAGGIGYAKIGDPSSVSVTITDTVSDRYDLDDALADYPGAWTAVDRPDPPITSGVDLEATNDTQLNDYLGNTAYNGRRIIVKNGGTFSPTAEHTLRGNNKYIEFEAGVQGVGRIPFALNGDNPPFLIHAYGAVARDNEIAWFGPVASLNSSIGYYDILIDGLNIDINRDNPTWAPQDGQAWNQCNRVAYLNTYLGHMGYGFALDQSNDIVLANSWLARTSSAVRVGSSGNKHSVRSEYSQRVAVVGNKLDHTLDVPGNQSGSPYRVHYGSAFGDSQGYQNSEHHFCRGNAMEGRGNLQVLVSNESNDGYAGRSITDVLIELNSYRRVGQSPGQALITTGFVPPESGTTVRSAPINYSFRNNRNYADQPSGNESDWLLTTGGGSVPADWGDMTGNVDGLTGDHTEFDDWDYS